MGTASLFTGYLSIPPSAGKRKVGGGGAFTRSVDEFRFLRFHRSRLLRTVLHYDIINLIDWKEFVRVSVIIKKFKNGPLFRSIYLVLVLLCTLLERRHEYIDISSISL